MSEKPFESQSYTIIETLMQEDKLSHEEAEKFWYEWLCHNKWLILDAPLLPS